MTGMMQKLNMSRKWKNSLVKNGKMKLKKWNKKDSIADETSISDIGSNDTALPRSHAVWVLYVRSVCSDGSVPEGFIDE